MSKGRRWCPKSNREQVCPSSTFVFCIVPQGTADALPCWEEPPALLTNSKANLFWKHHQRHTRSYALLAPWASLSPVTLTCGMNHIASMAGVRRIVSETWAKRYSEAFFGKNMGHIVLRISISYRWRRGCPRICVRGHCNKSNSILEKEQ